MPNKFLTYIGDIVHKIRGTYLGSNGEELRENIGKVWKTPSKGVRINTTFGRTVEGRLVNFDGHIFNLWNVVMQEFQPVTIEIKDSYSFIFNHDFMLDKLKYGDFGVDIRDVRKSYLIK